MKLSELSYDKITIGLKVQSDNTKNFGIVTGIFYSDYCGVNPARDNWPLHFMLKDPDCNWLRIHWSNDKLSCDEHFNFSKVTIVENEK